MIIENNYKEYSTAYDFLLDCNLAEIKSVFKGDILKEALRLKKEDLCEFISLYLNSFGWSDEEIILEVLKNRDKKYILNFVDDRQDGYFEVFKIKEDYEEKQ